MNQVVVFRDSPLGEYLADFENIEQENSVYSSVVFRSLSNVLQSSWSWISRQFGFGLKTNAIPNYSNVVLYLASTLRWPYIILTEYRGFNYAFGSILVALTLLRYPRTPTFPAILGTLAFGTIFHSHCSVFMWNTHLQMFYNLSKQFLSSHRKILLSVQEIELVSRGFGPIKPGQPCPPISRIEKHGLSSIRCEKARAVLSGHYSSIQRLLLTKISEISELDMSTYLKDIPNELTLASLKSRHESTKSLLKIFINALIYNVSSSGLISDSIKMSTEIARELKIMSKAVDKYDPLKSAFETISINFEEERSETTAQPLQKSKRRISQWIENYESIRVQNAALLENLQMNDDETVERMLQRLVSDVWLLRNDLENVTKEIRRESSPQRSRSPSPSIHSKESLVEIIENNVDNKKANNDLPVVEMETLVFEGVPVANECIKLTREARLKKSHERRLALEKMEEERRQRFEFNSQILGELENVLKIR